MNSSEAVIQFLESESTDRTRDAFKTIKLVCQDVHPRTFGHLRNLFLQLVDKSSENFASEIPNETVLLARVRLEIVLRQLYENQKSTGASKNLHEIIVEIHQGKFVPNKLIGREWNKDSYGSVTKNFNPEIDGSRLLKGHKLLAMLDDDVFRVTYREFKNYQNGTSIPTFIEEEPVRQEQRTTHRHKSRINRLCSYLIEQHRKNIEKHIENIQHEKLLNWKNRKDDQVLLVERSLIQILRYDLQSHNGCTVVLGNAGVGKSLALQQFAIDAFHQSDGVGICPVYLSLSKWESNLSFEEFVLTELSAILHEKKSKIKKYLKDENLFIVADGFDEKPDGASSKYFKEIFEFSKAHPLLVSSRTEEFEKIRFKDNAFLRIYELLLLSEEQVLHAIGNTDKFDELEQLYSSGNSIKELMAVPLFLDRLCMLPGDEIHQLAKMTEANASSEDIMDKLWEYVVDFSFKQKWDKIELTDSTLDRFGDSKKDSKTKNKIRDFIYWIAFSTGSNIFYLENLQPAWLSGKTERLVYILFSRIISSVLLFMSIGLFLSGPIDFFIPGVFGGIVLTVLHYLQPTFLNTTKNEKNKNNHQKRKLKNALITFGNLLFILIFFGSIMALYFGLTAVRQESDMHYGIATTEAYVGIFATLFYAVIFSFRMTWQTTKADIKPVERIRGNLNRVMKFGLYGGALIGIICGLFAALTLQFVPDSTFGEWLTNSRERLSVGGTFLGFLAGFCYGFLAGGALGYLDRSKSWIPEEERESVSLSPNYGMWQSAKNALWSISIVFVVLSICCGLLSCLLLEWSQQVFLYGVKHGFSFGLIVGLWNGGFDLIQHLVLRCMFYLRGYAPIKFSQYLSATRILGLVSHRGTSFKFFHETLRSYLGRQSKDNALMDNQKSGLWKLVLTVLFLLGLLPVIALGIKKDLYWKTNGKFSFIQEDYLPVKQLNENSFAILQDFQLGMKSSSRYKVGAFTGKVNVAGTERAFLGFSIGDKWDYVERYPHAALLLVVNQDTIKIAERKGLNGVSIRSMDVAKGGTIQFIVNDKEYHNNSGTVNINLMKDGIQ
ncbi:MAG: hypothetical protein AAFQ94_20115 [Bacteroidota bacterium]